jgi:uncharacterized membrane protein YeaQ/YmgE (transglycosylase-associated protein family)
MDIIGLLTNLIGGGIGGGVSGAALKEKSLGAIGNIIAGMVGGTLGSYILQGVGLLETLGVADMSVGSFANLAAEGGLSAISGAIVTAVAGVVKNKLGK